jgi:hypothetical protein
VCNEQVLGLRKMVAGLAPRAPVLDPAMDLIVGRVARGGADEQL